ncbi:MAG: hypothetical protein HUU08_10980 [Candidatus Brocadia sp.]|nr:hypothetical protein [Candidatus Brocadia sp.]
MPEPVSPDLVVSLRTAYLNRIFESSRQLSLAGVDPKAASSEKEARLSLDAVYTALLTLTPEAHEEMQRAESPEKKIQRQSALEQLNRHPSGRPRERQKHLRQFRNALFVGRTPWTKRTQYLFAYQVFTR